ncbi:hypothetical protein [Metabacillus fastidiosus]|uniref:hypothetical protein n=1 Tax=Metabacillus fastidiosus TaxID=1458 RepID=UPI003D2DA98D
MILEEVKEFNDKQWKTSDDLDNLINTLGCENVVFTIPDKEDKNKIRKFVMVDQGGIRSYKKEYKIYLLSTDLEIADNYYVMDLLSLIRDGYVNVHYRHDLLD